ncbi:hypothetical protein V8F20_000598 [Naviculisporaceae sp. PSN 640]
MGSIIPFAKTAMEAFAQTWNFTSITGDTTDTSSPGTEQGNDPPDHGSSEGDVQSMATTPLAGPEAQNESDSENDLITVIRNSRRTHPESFRQSSESQPSAGPVSPDKPLTISSETPFTKVKDETKSTWSSFIVGNFLPEVNRDPTPEVSPLSPQEGHISNVSSLPRQEGRARGVVQDSTRTETRQKRTLTAEGISEAGKGHHDHASPSAESRSKRRRLDRQRNQASRTSQQPAVRGQNHTSEQGPTNTPSQTLSRETFKAIKHTPITAEGKARQRLMDIKQGKAPETDEDLFKFFEAKHATPRRNQIANGILPSPERQREAADNSFSSPRKPPPAQPRSNIPKHNIVLPKPKTRTQASNKTLSLQSPPKTSQPGPSKKAKPQGKPPASGAATITIRSVSPEPTDASPPPAPPPPVRTVSAEDFLGGPERLVLQWVVYRTQRYSSLKTLPTGQVITVDKQWRKIRCTTHLSKRAANEAAAARHERIHKDVVKKSWSLTGYGKGLFEGMLEYGPGEGSGKGDVGDVMHFWVEQELTDLAKVTEKWNSEGKTLLLDLGKAGVYARKRYDVWSTLVYPAPGSTERSRRQNLVIDCGGDGDENKEEEMDRDDESSASGANVDVSFASTETLVGDEASVGTDPGVTSENTGLESNQETPEEAEIDGSTTAKVHDIQENERHQSPEIDASISAKADDIQGNEKHQSPEIEASASEKEGDIRENERHQTPETDASTSTKADDIQEGERHQSPVAHALKDQSLPINPFTLILPPKQKHHGSYTTPKDANIAALQAFLDLTKPKNARLEDNHFYKHFMAPEMEKLFWDEQNRDPDSPVKLQWDATEALENGCKWDFLHIEVAVVETELEGVVDLGGMAVDGGPPPAPPAPDDAKGKGKGKEVSWDLPNVAESEEEDESEVSEAE